MSATEANVPDSIRPYLNEIAERLWVERAVVMVGAGFSKNAGNEFPDWTQLGDLFYQKNHGVKPDSTEQKYLNVLRLAEELQAGIGRPALENLLRASIPDLDVEPSDLHVELLKLPWADVFTTNYDTLLERASAKVVTRRYEPVINKEDIPYAVKPRIVKLHGSFPSERPFIITEEDYRRYPNDFAPFVNTVQQALLENTFCLIGFSGDDPNFLRWIGWIRDNLGKDKTQKIYLVGVFDLSPARLQLLAQRGIVVVDLSCCEGVEKHDHKKALERFFGYMQSNKPDVLDWPYNPQMMSPSRDADCKEVRKITEEWQRQRQAYPGWLILPNKNRENLWVFTSAWVDCLPDTEKSAPGLDLQYAFELIWRLERCLLPVFDKLAELCEKLLEKYWPFQNENPPTNYQIHPGKEKYQELPWNDLRQAWLAIAVAMLRFYREEGCLDKWQKSENQLNIPSLSDHLSAEQREFLHYEGFLFSLFTLDLPNAKQRLENWQPNETQPYWMAKRAAAFAELGLLNKMDDQIRLSLVETRKRRKNYARCFSISNEAYQMVLFRYISDVNLWSVEKTATPEEVEQIKKVFLDKWKRNKQVSESKRQASYIAKLKPQETFSTASKDWECLVKNREDDRKLEWDKYLRNIRDDQRKRELQQQNARWDELKAFRCDPWNELKLYELKLDRPSVQRKTLTEKREFDIGRISRIHHFHGTDQEALSAYSFLRFCEEVGLPGYTMLTKTALVSLQCISNYSLFWAIATLFRLGSGDARDIDSLFSRESVYKFSADKADQLIQNYLDALNRNRDEIQGGGTFRNINYAVRLAQFLPEVISRLCCKCSDKTKGRVLDFVAGLYASSYKANYGNVKNLTKRLISSMSQVEQYRLVPGLLKIPFPEGLDPYIEGEYLNPFSLLEINQKPEGAPAVNIQSRLVDDLFRQAALNDPARRRWVITSLVTLYDLQLLDDEQISKLAEVLWRETDQYGLPDGTNFYKFAFLIFPYPENVDPAQLFKNYVMSMPFPIQKDKQGRGVHITGGDIHIVREILGANSNDGSIWTAEDAIDILQRLLEWWDADKERLKEKENVPKRLFSTEDEFRVRFSRLLELLAEVVGPKLRTDLSVEIKMSLRRLLKEVREYGLPGITAEATCLHIYPDQKTEVYNRINEALISDQSDLKKDGLNAISKIIIDGNEADVNSLDANPTSMLRQYLTWCSINSISLALWVIARILKNSPNSISDGLKTAVQRRLDRLLTDTEYDRDNLYLSFDEKLEVRRVSSNVAAELWKYYNSRSLSVPEAVEKWRQLSLSPDEFSEIRNPWKDWD
ncbi:SIR2 family protein [Gilvimarinus agarilyticus]|uniref:anti-phage defense-associated sirtuin Dsr2 n=1 Tax=Gilvimarinus sp. 2_MG-2023 TaxID=3062666 RepID=UPI001C08353D|nr:anti-phage defense-associated sirtuin Dsr2 [Gilvimarinus sp. 2_MG-2023]MBU2887358.1 SIR2 family protein [Gilvimarinus agarilyticus]MDO6572016.1 anti-phage defense-associated sirtuin Dsr2 [Gilvimarinus sp. 2_MG-2023]